MQSVFESASVWFCTPKCTVMDSKKTQPCTVTRNWAKTLTVRKTILTG
jgi:hypothetical protein